MKDKIITMIASVLKPVDETRMYEKFGISLQQSDKFQVNMIGFSSKNENQNKDIYFFPVFNFSRLSIHRFLAPIKFFLLALQINPHLLIITTHELILAAIMYKILKPKVKLIYDIQENYYSNVLYHHHLPTILRYTLAIWIRAKEKFSNSFFSHYFLAEQSYTKEFSFSKTKQTVILNKYRPIPSVGIQKRPIYPGEPLKIIYSGTIHPLYGIYQAVELAKALSIILAIKFLVIGHITHHKLLKYLVESSRSYPWITLEVDTKPIPHLDILKEMQDADFGIVSHQPVPSIAHCFPTRIYEFMAFQLPILLQDHAPWTRFCNRWDSCIALDFNHFNAEHIAQQMRNRKFYTFGPPTNIYWESEEKKLLSGLEKICQKSG